MKVIGVFKVPGIVQQAVVEAIQVFKNSGIVEQVVVEVTEVFKILVMI